MSGNVTLPESSKIVERMTDASLYPSSHKLRFSSTGNLSSNTSPNKSNFKQASSASRSTSSTNLSAKAQGVVSSSRPQSGSIKKNTSNGSGVFDRLTDTSQYTGTHKERFNQDGTGKGIDGRRSQEDNKGLNLRTFLK